jgi:threonine dehydrogenase-like Zn-dependent dehydrogenase
VGHHQEKLDILARRGIQTAMESELAESQADLVVEATGRPEGYTAARRLVRPRGAIVLKSTYHDQVEADLTMAVVDEITLVGSRCGPFPPALRLLEHKLVDVAPLIEARYPLSEALAAFEHAARPGALKVLIDTASSHVRY